METFIQFWIKIVQMIVIVIFAYLFIIRQKKGYYGFIYLNLFLLSAFLQGVVEITFFLLAQNGKKFSIMISLPIEHVFYALTLLFLVMHFEYYLNTGHLPTFFSLLFISIIGTAYFIDLKYDLGFFSFQPTYHLGIGRLWLFLFDIYQLYCVTLVFIGGIIILLSARKTSFKWHAIIISFSTFIVFIAGILEFLEHFIPNFDPYGGLTFGIPLFIVLLLYTISPNFVFFSPEPIYQFIILNNDGQIIYRYGDFSAYPIPDENTIGGVIHAFQLFIEDLTKNQKGQSLRYIQLENSAIILQRRDPIYGIIITDRYCQLYKNSLKIFVLKFHEEFREEIKNFTGDISVFDRADIFVKKIFPFVSKSE